MRVLALDACLHDCTAALFDGGALVAALSDPMERGHAERLPVMADALLQQAGWAPQDLEEIVSTVGPGGFAGARIGPAFARGLALAGGARTAGLSTLAALAASVPDVGPPILVVIDARRGGLYTQSFAPNAAAAAEWPVAEAWRAAPEGRFRLVGSGAQLFCDAAPAPVASRADLTGAVSITPNSFLRGRVLDPDRACSPLYLRAPDAKKPQRPSVS